MPPKPKEDKTSIKGFKDGSSNWWCNDSHYHLNEAGELIWCSGGMDTEELRNAVLVFISRNKKTYRPREKSLFETEEKEYTKVTFGKFSGMSTIELTQTDKSYANWLYKSTTDLKIKKELKELLKIK
mgnify:FL=1